MSELSEEVATSSSVSSQTPEFEASAKEADNESPGKLNPEVPQDLQITFEMPAWLKAIPLTDQTRELIFRSLKGHVENVSIIDRDPVTSLSDITETSSILLLGCALGYMGQQKKQLKKVILKILQLEATLAAFTDKVADSSAYGGIVVSPLAAAANPIFEEGRTSGELFVKNFMKRNYARDPRQWHMQFRRPTEPSEKKVDGERVLQKEEREAADKAFVEFIGHAFDQTKDDLTVKKFYASVGWVGDTAKCKLYLEKIIGVWLWNQCRVRRRKPFFLKTWHANWKTISELNVDRVKAKKAEMEALKRMGNEKPAGGDLSEENKGSSHKRKRRMRTSSSKYSGKKIKFVEEKSDCSDDDDPFY
eukprot:821205_1